MITFLSTLTQAIVSADCPDLINFAIGLNVDKKPGSSNIWTALQIDCCTASGVVCVNNTVTEIYWDSMGLDGFLNQSAMPKGLQLMEIFDNDIGGTVPTQYPVGFLHLDLWNNYLEGTIPSNLPDTLIFMDLSANNLVGGIPVLPSGIQSIDLNSCNLDGPIPYLPPSLNYLMLYYNSLSGPLPTLPDGLQTLSVTGNQLTGTIPVLPSSAQEMWFDGNQFTGDVPIIPSSVYTLVLGSSGYTGNKFTGSLVVYKPQKLLIYQNLITDVIVQDTSQLTDGCDLSYNPLLGNPVITNLTMCTKTGLYSANTLPNTLSYVAISATVENHKTTKLNNLKTTKRTGINATFILGQSILLPSQIFFTNLAVLLRIFLSGMILGAVVIKTPFKRHFKEKHTESGTVSELMV